MVDDLGHRNHLDHLANYPVEELPAAQEEKQQEAQQASAESEL